MVDWKNNEDDIMRPIRKPVTNGRATVAVVVDRPAVSHENEMINTDLPMFTVLTLLIRQLTDRQLLLQRTSLTATECWQRLTGNGTCLRETLLPNGRAGVAESLNLRTISRKLKTTNSDMPTFTVKPILMRQLTYLCVLSQRRKLAGTVYWKGLAVNETSLRQITMKNGRAISHKCETINTDMPTSTVTIFLIQLMHLRLLPQRTSLAGTVRWQILAVNETSLRQTPMTKGRYKIAVVVDRHAVTYKHKMTNNTDLPTSTVKTSQIGQLTSLCLQWT